MTFKALAMTAVCLVAAASGADGQHGTETTSPLNSSALMGSMKSLNDFPRVINTRIGLAAAFSGLHTSLLITNFPASFLKTHLTHSSSEKNT